MYLLSYPFMIRRNNVEAVRFLLENQVKTVPKTFSETALHTAADNNRAEIADLLLQHNRCVHKVYGNR